jgi:ribosomal protein S18 acetylase RimI-like enzyme
MNSAAIREANVNDIPQIVHLYLGLQEYKGILPDELISPANDKDLVPFITGKSTSRKYIVALDEKQNIVGVCYLDVSFEKLQAFRIGEFIVDKQFRNQGIGKQMLTYIKKYCKERNVKKLWLWTQEELTEAIHFYEKNGFSIEGKQKAQFLGKDALLMGQVI